MGYICLNIITKMFCSHRPFERISGTTTVRSVRRRHFENRYSRQTLIKNKMRLQFRKEMYYFNYLMKYLFVLQVNSNKNYTYSNKLCLVFPKKIIVFPKPSQFKLNESLETFFSLVLFQFRLFIIILV